MHNKYTPFIRYRGIKSCVAWNKYGPTYGIPLGTEFDLKQSTFAFWDKIFPQKRFWRQNLRKKLPNLESVPLNILVYWVLFETKHFEVSGKILPKISILGTKSEKTIVKFGMNTLDYTYVLSFI